MSLRLSQNPEKHIRVGGSGASAQSGSYKHYHSQIIHCARWVVPVEQPLVENGAVVVSGGKILAVGRAVEICRQYSGAVKDHGRGAILPALVNAHTHLEFSALRGRIGPTADLGEWLAAAMAGMGGLTEEAIISGVRRGLEELRRHGTGLVAEVSNTGLSWPELVNSGMEFHYFYECLGFDNLNTGPLAEDFPMFGSPAKDQPNFSAAAHAVYSVSPELCRRLQSWNQRHGRPTGVHLAESREEVSFLHQGEGFCRRLLESCSRWRPDFRPPGCSPVAYLDGLGFFQGRTVAAHGVWLTREDQQILAARDVWVVLCPRSNRHTGAGFPNLPGLWQAGIKLALGTDSLASTPDFNLFREMLTLLQEYPDFPPAELLALATVGGAQALGRGAELGSITEGKKAALLFIPVEGERDFWRSLLHAGGAGQIRWLTD